jgi:uncharacterized Zn-binding protein involved in type VI secretion
MAGLSRLGDTNQVGGKILRGSATVFCDGKPVGLHVSPISPHPKGKPHKTSKTTDGSPTVFCDGVPVLRIGSGNTCGHSIVQGSSKVNVP